MAGHRILLVDDSLISLQLAKAVLEAGGYRVRTVHDLAALDGDLEDWVPELILTDVQMPDLTGDALCRRLKGKYDTAHVPVVLFSSMASDQLAKLAHECAADGFLSKQEGLDTLCENVERLCDELIW